MRLLLLALALLVLGEAPSGRLLGLLQLPVLNRRRLRGRMQRQLQSRWGSGRYLRH